MAKDSTKRRTAGYVVSYVLTTDGNNMFFRTTKITLTQRKDESLLSFENMLENEAGELTMRLADLIEEKWKDIAPLTDADVCVLNYWKDGEHKFEDTID